MRYILNAISARLIEHAEFTAKQYSHGSPLKYLFALHTFVQNMQ